MNGCLFAQLNDGDYFVYDGYVWRRIAEGSNTNWPRQNGVRVLDAWGKRFSDAEFVRPVAGGEEPVVQCMACGRLRKMSEVWEMGTLNLRLYPPLLEPEINYACMDSASCLDHAKVEQDRLSMALARS